MGNVLRNASQWSSFRGEGQGCESAIRRLFLEGNICTLPCVNDSQDTSQTGRSLGKGIWIVLALILVVFGVYSFLIAPLIPDNKYDPLSALFSGLAFWGVIYAILLQKSELALQRKELELTRGEVRGQKEQLEAQNLNLRQQRFEQTLFSLLDLFNITVSSLQVTGRHMLGDTPPILAAGRDCFPSFYGELERQYNSAQNQQPELPYTDLCKAAYEQFPEAKRQQLGHYFKTLGHIIEFIATSEVRDKHMYVKILRAQLSSTELKLLLYYTLGQSCPPNLIAHIEKFGLLEGLEPTDLLRPAHYPLIGPSAYKYVSE